ncbi:MAG TPA: hypothetical protein VKD91_20540 [Pyrinomonadaceae bacterium]|nr:hypothetical protein [Pyrinomonadaceae bacterium]
MNFGTLAPSLCNSWRLLYAGLLWMFLTASALGQGNPAGPPAGAGPPLNKNPNVADRSRQVDESELRGAEMTAGTDEERQKRVQTAIANMKEDFARIQILRNDIARSLVARKPLDYKLIREQTAEINKRSNRLNVYLRAHAPTDGKEDKSAELTSDEVIGALVRLCKLIDSFTENPALKDAAVVNSQEVSAARENRARADKDLLAIIKLSAGLQKTAQGLKVSH